MLPSPASPSAFFVLSAKLQKNSQYDFHIHLETLIVIQLKNNSVADSYGNQKGQRAPEKPGRIQFAPKCHGWHHRSYGFLPDNNNAHKIKEDSVNLGVFIGTNRALLDVLVPLVLESHL